MSESAIVGGKPFALPLQRLPKLDVASLELDGYGVMHNRSQIPMTSSTMDVGTVNGVVAETSSMCAAMSSAVRTAEAESAPAD